MKDLCYENCKTMIKEIENNINKWKDTRRLWIGRIYIDKISMLHKAIYRFSATPVKIPKAYSTEVAKIILKFVGNHKWPQITKATLRTKRKTGSITLPDFQLWHKALKRRIWRCEIYKSLNELKNWWGWWRKEKAKLFHRN